MDILDENNTDEINSKDALVKTPTLTENAKIYTEVDINNTDSNNTDLDVSNTDCSENAILNTNVIFVGSKPNAATTKESIENENIIAESTKRSQNENVIAESSKGSQNVTTESFQVSQNKIETVESCTGSQNENEIRINSENGLITPKTEEGIDETRAAVNRKPYKQRRSELERLGKQEVFDDEYTAFSDDINVYKKYKFRRISHTPKIEEPTVQVKLSKLKEELSCQRCFQKFENRYSLTNHMQSHQDTYLCLLCSQRFNNNDQLISHKSTHEKQSFLCSECKLAFSEHKDYLVHYYSHIKELHVQCLECEQIFKKRNITSHVMSHFSKQIKCPTCFISFNSEASYENHRSRHGYIKSNEKITCIECGETVKVSKDEFERHMYRHTGVKKYQCLFCGKCFATDVSRNFHTRLHSDFQQYKCKKCDKSFTQINDFKKHMLRHGEKTVQCDVCKRKFYDKYALKCHMRLHNEERLYKCTECDFSSSSSTGLRSHMISKHTVGNHISCEICNCELSQLKYYLKHCRSKRHKRNLYGLGNNSENELEEVTSE